MKIKEINMYSLAIPFTKPKTWGWNTRKYANVNLIEVIDEDGIKGYGEMHGAGNKNLLKNTIIPKLINKNLFEIEKINREVTSPWNFRNTGIEWAGTQTAIFDLIGKKYNLPLYNLLGGIYREKIEISPTIFINKIDDILCELKGLINEGYKSFNLKAGRCMAHDVEVVKTIREELGYNIKIAINANMLLSLPTAVQFFNKLEKFDIFAIYTPLEPNALDGYKKLRTTSIIPIGIHDDMTTKEDAVRYCSNQAIDIGTACVGLSANILESKKICTVFESFSLPVALFAGESGISQMACFHVACSTPNAIFPIESEYTTMDDDILVNGKLQFKNGSFKISNNPGLGIELDWERINKYSENYKRVCKEDYFDTETNFITYSMK